MNVTETVLVDCLDEDIKGKELNFEHARKLFRLQHEKKRNDWTLSEGQNFKLKNGDLIKQSDSANPPKEDKTGRARKLPNP